VSVFDDVRAEWVGKLRAAGVTDATADPVANVPFVLVQPLSDDGRPQGIGGWPATLTISIVVPPPGDAAAMTALQDRLQLVLTTFPAPRSWVPGTYGPNELPAYTVTYPVTVPNPNC